MEAAIPFTIITWFCAATFIGIGIFAFKKKTPMHFWSGTTVKPGEISDVKAYNKANGIMWIGYGAIVALSGLLSFVFGTAIGGIFLTVSCTLGLLILIIVYGKIYNKYKN